MLLKQSYFQQYCGYFKTKDHQSIIKIGYNNHLVGYLECSE